jgi:lysophospholipase L1-like esterase
MVALGMTAASGACSVCSPASGVVPSTGAVAPFADRRYVALGDSFTAGTGAMPSEAFPARLVAHWGCHPSDLLVDDLGVDGYATDDLIADELPQLRRSPRAPQIVTLAIGANDIVRGADEATYRAHVRSILAAIVASGANRIVAIPQPDWSTSPAARAFGAPATLHASIAAFNAILEAETTAVSGHYVDLSALMQEQAAAHMLAADGLHPSAAAYDAWAAALAERVTSPCVASNP